MEFVDSFIKTHPSRNIQTKYGLREYLVGGKGTNCFLIFPGSGQDALSCYDLIDVFEKQYKVIAINYDRFFSLDSFFEYVNNILKQEKVNKVILYGLSLGGFLAQHYVRKYPSKVDKLILSHSGSTKSKTVIRHVIIPGKILYFFIPIIPQSLLNRLFKPIAGRVQAGQSDIIGLYKKYSTEENLKRRTDFARKTTFSVIDKNYLKTVYSLGVDMQRAEKKFLSSDLSDWKGKIFILRTDNDPLAQDNGMFTKYYPQAIVHTFKNTGHLTPFIRFEEMTEIISKFIKGD